MRRMSLITRQQNDELKGRTDQSVATIVSSIIGAQERNTYSDRGKNSTQQRVPCARGGSDFHLRRGTEIAGIGSQPASACLSGAYNHLQVRVGIAKQFLTGMHKRLGRFRQERHLY